MRSNMSSILYCLCIIKNADLYRPRLPSSSAILLKADSMLLYGTTSGLIPWVYRKCEQDRQTMANVIILCLQQWQSKINWSVKKNEQRDKWCNHLWQNWKKLINSNHFIVGKQVNVVEYLIYSTAILFVSIECFQNIIGTY